jgi:hypothetical protein
MRKHLSTGTETDIIDASRLFHKLCFILLFATVWEEVPIIQAPIAPYTSAQLVAAVSNAGGLGSIGTALQSIDDFKKQVDQT